MCSFVEKLILPPRTETRWNLTSWAASADPERSDLDVLPNGQRSKRAAVLEGAYHAGPRPSMSAPTGDVSVAELDGAGSRQIEAGEHVHERRLAGAVRPDEADDLMGV